MTGKEKCEVLKSIRKQIAEANNIVYMEPECHHEGDCLGTCPKCDAQLRYLDAEINRKIAKGEQVTISGISVEAFEWIVGRSEQTNDMDVDELDIACGAAQVVDENEEEDHIDVADLSVSCGVMEDRETDGYEKINSMNIDELELSVRSYNCLKRAGISTVGELRSKSSEDMMKVRNLGRKSLEEVIAKMRELGIDDFCPRCEDREGIRI